MAHILITGGAGFIGTNLANELRGRGHEVKTLDINFGEDKDHYRCDVRSFWQLREIFKNNKFDFVYHIAAEYGRWNGEDHYENLWNTNVVGTKNILRLQEEYGFKQIFFSSAEVYGDYEGKMKEEIMDQIAIKQTNDYAITKWAGELQVLNSAEMFGTETVRVRPVNCYGPHEHYNVYRGVIPIFVYKALMNQPYTVYMNHYRIFDYVEDTARTFANIADNFIPGEVYNIGGKEDWIHEIKYVSDVIRDYLKLDDSLVEYKEAEPFTTKTKQIDFSKSRRDLNHDPKIPLEEGVIKYIEWMKDYYRV